MTQTPPMAPSEFAPIPRLAAQCFAGVAVFLLFASHPCALVPLGLNPDAPWLRLTGIILLVLWAAWRLRQLAPAGSQYGRLKRLLWPISLLLVVIFLPAGFAGDAQYFRLPSEYALGMLALAMLLYWPVCWTRWSGAALAFLLAPAIWHFSQTLRLPEEHLGVIAPLTIALLVAALWRQQTWPSSSIIKVASLLWALLVLFALIELAQGAEPDAFTLNRNWLGCALAALLPWPLVYLGELSWSARWRRLGQGLALLGSLILVWLCHSRGAWLGVLSWGLGIALCWRVGGRRRYWVWGLILVCGIVLLGSWASKQLSAAASADLRLPLWRTAWQLSLESPWVGVGPADFEARFFPMLAGSGYHDRWVATERS
jgi:hypothetical protein